MNIAGIRFGITPEAPGGSARVPTADSKLADAAKSFEALMIGQILKAAHGSESQGWLGAGDDDETSATAIQVAEEYLGQAIANGGGLGIAGLVLRGVGKSAAKSASSGTAPSSFPSARTDLPGQT